MGLFGPSQQDIWQAFADEIGGEYIGGGIFSAKKIIYNNGNWTFLLDTYTVDKTVFTRMRAPFVNPEKLFFKIYRHSVFSSIGKAMGMQDIEIGDLGFDEDFILKGNDPKILKLLLEDIRIKNYFQQLRKVCIEIKENDGFFGADFPEGTDELYFRCPGILRDQNQLKTLFDLFALILERLVRVDVASNADPGVQLT